MQQFGPSGRLASVEIDRVTDILDREKCERQSSKTRHFRFERPVNPRDAVVINSTEPEQWHRHRALPADLPLVRAKIAGRITLEQFNAGNCYRVIYAKAQPEIDGRDSTQAMLIDRKGGPGSIPVSYVDVESARSLSLMTRNLSRIDNILIQLFCGLGRKASEAIRFACPRRDPAAVWDRMGEALDELERVIRERGVPRPDGAPELTE